MPRGGFREGAGRKKGAPNKATAAREKAVRASGLTPLDFMLSVLRDETQDLPVRLDAAKSVAPYVHPRLASIDMNANIDGRIVVEIVEIKAPIRAELELKPVNGSANGRA